MGLAVSASGLTVEVREYAVWLGMSLPADDKFLYIAKEGLGKCVCGRLSNSIYYAEGCCGWLHVLVTRI